MSSSSCLIPFVVTAYEPTVVRTPNLDRFAGQSCVFENTHAGSFPTMPPRLDIMSGRSCHVDHEWCLSFPRTHTMRCSETCHHPRACWEPFGVVRQAAPFRNFHHRTLAGRQHWAGFGAMHDRL